MIKKIFISNPLFDVIKIRQNINLISNENITKVKSIIENVILNGDNALLKYTKEFDKIDIESLLVTKQDINDAYDQVTESQISTLRLIKRNLEKNEKKLLKNFKNNTIHNNGIKITRVIKSISSVGCYIPGGKATYPSSLIMCAVPAKIAGVKRIIAISPPQKNGMVDPLTLVASDICNIDEFYKVGGAHGIAALAYGTNSIRSVDKIVGPGGIFVTIAKFLVSSKTSIDMIAGPTELLIFADSTADPKLVALDLISQAEHSIDTLCGVVTTSKDFSDKLELEINKIFSQNIWRSEIVKTSITNNGFIAICDDNDSAIQFINEFAPEHLEIISKRERSIAKKIHSAGVILVGKNSPSAASDYCLGSNHVLPTLGFGKSRGGLSVLDFIKIISIVESTSKGLKNVKSHIKAITESESLINHWQAVNSRL